MVNPGQTVALTAGASDTNTPALSLTFSLLNAPSGATVAQLNATNAVFIWRPALMDANKTNTVTLEVADNGVPSLTATQSFHVVVNPWTRPAFSSASAGNGQFTLQVNGENGPDYAVECSTNLMNWTTLLITNSPSMPWNWTDSNRNTFSAQFYRIKAGPPLP
jgi:hypothetical protein